MHPEQIYWVAHNLYTGGKYADAERMFRVLALRLPRDKRFWMGLGACLQMQHQYQSAINAYSRILSEADPYPYIHLAECYLGLHQTEEMLNQLDLAKIIASKEQKFDNLIKHLTLWEKTHVTQS